jgi:hypothetical protein
MAALFSPKIEAMSRVDEALDDDDDDEPITLGGDVDPPERDLGPDERDMDLLDGSWEQDYYAGRVRSRDWRSVGIGIALLLLIALTLPAVLVLER